MVTASVPTADLSAVEFLVGETVTSGSTGTAGAGGPLTPINPTNVNDRNVSTHSQRSSGVFLGGPTYWWACDFGSAVEVHTMHVWDVDLPTVRWRTPATLHPATVIIERSSNGTSWTSEAFSVTSSTVSTGGTPATATEWRYTLTTPGTFRYWRIRKIVPAGGFVEADAMREWFVNGFVADPGSAVWVDAPDTIDGDDGTSDDVTDGAVTATAGPFWRSTRDSSEVIAQVTALVGMENSGDVSVLLQGATDSDYSDATTVVQFDYEATGGFTGDELTVQWDAEDDYQFWQLVLDTAAQAVEVYEVGLSLAAEPTPAPSPGKAVLEIYVHDEDASRWGEATWATGPATGTEGIWSAAGWQDVTPQGIWAHIIWGSRRPDRGILAEQDPASWTVETYDPDRILDPGNPDSPYAPQLLAGVPIRISHEDGLVIRTGQIDDWQYNYKPPAYKGRILASDTIALLHRAYTPADSILGDTLMERIQDAINAAGIMVGGIPLPPGGPSGPALSEWVEGAATDDDTRVWDIIRKAGEEALYVIYVDAAAGLGMRPWGSPLERGREIGAPNLEDLASRTSEDGVYSVVKVQVADPDLDPIIRVAAPLPRYGRRVYERTETTIDPEGWAAAVLADRAWQGVQYVPGAIHCFTAADVQHFGSLEIMERVQITHAGVVTVSGRILGGELWVEGRTDRDAKWIFQFHVATDGSTAVGLTSLVSDQSGEPLLDDMTETDFLEAD